MELDSIPQPALDQIERVHGADLLVGVIHPGTNGRPPAAMVREALRAFSQPPRAVLVVDESAAPSANGDETSLPIVSFRLGGPSSSTLSPQTFFTAYRTVLGIGRRVGVRACTVIASELQTVTPLWIDRL